MRHHLGTFAQVSGRANILRMARIALHLSGDKEADAVISKDPLALVIGMVLDQQIPLEKAFSSPSVLRQRLGGTLDAAAIAAMDPVELERHFKEWPALHRFPGSMAKRVQEVCRVVAEDYGGKADAIWKKNVPDAATLLERVRALRPDSGEQKAKIFTALLGKQLGIQPDGWREASKPFGDAGSFLSIADITDTETLAKVRAHKQAMKAKAKARAKA